jgi:uncharacterized Fe-S cluster-containing protein
MKHMITNNPQNNQINHIYPPFWISMRNYSKCDGEKYASVPESALMAFSPTKNEKYLF